MTRAGSGGSQPGAEEREVKLAVEESFVLPELSSLDGVIARELGEKRLRAVYWDTDALGLANAGVGLRHRNGVWAFKGPSRREGDAVVRNEVEVSGTPDSIPEALRAHLEGWSAAALHPVAELDTSRRTIDVSAGDMRVEVVHDRVRVVDGALEVSRFSEVEVEFEPGSTDLADRMVRLLKDRGGVVETTPKLVRALRALGRDPSRIEL